MLGVTAILFCERCEAATARSERGWRAYVVGANDEARVATLCPSCSERHFGEDEAAWSD
jgi:uncharacterized protein YifE (UPF0438 family)